MADDTLPAGIARTVEALAVEQTRRRAYWIERAAEEALQGGEHGVLINETERTAVVDAQVPYGKVLVVRPQFGELGWWPPIPPSN